MNSDDGIELASLIQQLRGELSLAMWSGDTHARDGQLRFELGQVELEIEFVVGRSSSPGAKAKLLVVDVEYGQQRNQASTHRIKLAMQPRVAGNPDQKPWVSGVPVPEES